MAAEASDPVDSEGASEPLPAPPALAAPAQHAERFSLRRIAIPACGPLLLFGLGQGAILPVIALSVRDLGGSVPLVTLVVTLIGIGSLVTNIPASIITTRYGERWALVAAAVWSGLAMVICVLVKSLVAFAGGIFMASMAGSVFGRARQSYLTE